MSKFKIELESNPDFDEACRLFKVQADEMLQRFVNAVNLTFYFAKPFGSHRDANALFLNFGVDIHRSNQDLKIIERCQEFTMRLTVVMSIGKDLDVKVRDILEEWHAINASDER